jgi:hypothetical protein
LASFGLVTSSHDTTSLRAVAAAASAAVSVAALLSLEKMG